MLSEEVKALQETVNQIGLGTARIELKLNTHDKAQDIQHLDQHKKGLSLADSLKSVDRYFECVLTPVLCSLENRIIEHHNLTCNGSGEWRDRLARIEAKLDALQAKKLLKDFKRHKRKRRKK